MRVEAIDAEIERITAAERDNSDRVRPLSDWREQMAASFRAFKAEQIPYARWRCKAVGTVSQDMLTQPSAPWSATEW